MKAYLTRRYWFSASHRLHCDSMSPEENRSVYGKCNNPHGHGHNYALEVTVCGPVDPGTGMICNLADLDSFVNEKIVERFGHENLNTLRFSWPKRSTIFSFTKESRSARLQIMPVPGSTGPQTVTSSA